MEEKDLEKQQKQEMYRHSMSHILAKAIKSIWGDVKLAIGPAIDNGFYYDIDMGQSIKPEDFGKIEDKMREIIMTFLTTNFDNLERRVRRINRLDEREDYD